VLDTAGIVRDAMLRQSSLSEERDLHSEEMAFIPAYTWVSVKNTSAETASIVFIFSEPGFGNHVRCVSVLANEKRP